MNSTQGLTTVASSTALCGFCGTAYSVMWGHTCHPTVQASGTAPAMASWPLRGGTLTMTTSSPSALCPDLLRYEQIGAADGLRGRVVRAVFWLLRAWPPRR